MNSIPTWVWGLVALAVVAFTVRGSRAAGGAAEGPKWVADGAVLVDVRTDGEFRAGHLDGAVNIPVQTLESRLGELEKDRAVVVYCRSGSRSARAKRILEQHGFAKVLDAGAMSSWPR